MHFKDNKINLIYIDKDYLRFLSTIDSEIFFDENNNYEEKPHVGLLIHNNGMKYVIPLTSAKEKHKEWADAAAGWFKIFEIINTKTDVVRSGDILQDIKNHDLLKDIPNADRPNTKQKIISVLDMRKMFPVIDGVYTNIPIQMSTQLDRSQNQKNALLMKEFFFLLKIKEKIEEKTEKIYSKQISSGKVLRYHCDYKKLEEKCNEFSKKQAVSV